MALRPASVRMCATELLVSIGGGTAGFFRCATYFGDRSISTRPEDNPGLAKVRDYRYAAGTAEGGCATWAIGQRGPREQIDGLW